MHAYFYIHVLIYLKSWLHDDTSNYSLIPSCLLSFHAYSSLHPQSSEESWNNVDLWKFLHLIVYWASSSDHHSDSLSSCRILSVYTVGGIQLRYITFWGFRSAFVVKSTWQKKAEKGSTWSGPFQHGFKGQLSLESLLICPAFHFLWPCNKPP